MKKLITAIVMMFCLVCGASAFETNFMSVDFDRMILNRNVGKNKRAAAKRRNVLRERARR